MNRTKERVKAMIGEFYDEFVEDLRPFLRRIGGMGDDNRDPVGQGFDKANSPIRKGLGGA